MTREERMRDEPERMMVDVGPGKVAHHSAIHIHAAHECGATKEDIYERIGRAAERGGAPESR